MLTALAIQNAKPRGEPYMLTDGNGLHLEVTPNIHTLREQFEDGAQSIEASPFADHIRRLDQTSQAYFENQLFAKTCSRTRPATAAAILPLRAISGS